MPATYYVSNGGGDFDGVTPATAWSYEIFNGKAIAPGDTVLFKRDETFYGPMRMQSGGNGFSPTNYGAYGTGKNPLISGLKTLTAWTKLSGQIYYATVDTDELNVVVINNGLMPMGRYPKTGYMQIEQVAGANVLKGQNIADLPFDPTGGEIVIRKIRQIMDRHFVVSRTGNAVQLSPNGGYHTNYGNNATYSPQEGFGFFFQSHLATLTADKEWFYDRAAKRLYVYFASEPTSYVVKASETPILLNGSATANVIFTNVDFEGANFSMFASYNARNIWWINCNTRFCKNGWNCEQVTDKFKFSGGSITDITNNGVLMIQDVSNVSLQNVQLTNIGAFPGMGGSGDSMYIGVWIDGNKTSVSHCKLDRIGFHGVVLNGRNTTIEHNQINNYGFVKDDAGAIYATLGSGVQIHNAVIRYNKITNGFHDGKGGPSYDPRGQAIGIYIDAHVNNTSIYNNEVETGSFYGIMLVNVAKNIVLQNNRVKGFRYGQVCIYQYGMLTEYLTLDNNRLEGIAENQPPIVIEVFADDDLSKLGNFDNNRYIRPDSTKPIQIIRNHDGWEKLELTLETWQANGYDLRSSHNAKLPYLTRNGKLLRKGGLPVMSLKTV